MFDPERFPARPDHPDFWHLSELMLQLDGATDADGMAAIDAVLDGLGLDKRSVVYMAQQRALRTGLQGEAWSWAAAAWLEAFLMGARWAKKYGRSDA